MSEHSEYPTKQCFLCGETITPDQIDVVDVSHNEGQYEPICADKHEPEWYRD